MKLKRSHDVGWNPTFTQLMVCGFFLVRNVLFSNVHFCTAEMRFVAQTKKVGHTHSPISYSCFLFHQNNDSLCKLPPNIPTCML